ncbi:Mob1/phocein, partial [Melanogaster broomeanus]
MATPDIQRPYRGSRVSSFYSVKSLPTLSSLDSAFQLQEYISLLIRLNVHDVDTIISPPGKLTSKESDERVPESLETDSKKPEEGDRKSELSVDRACWIYEQLRRLAQDLSHPLITMLQLECTRTSCPQMKAGEWLYLCVAHGNDGAMEQCCAIDYILHTLDSATALLNSPRAFPSRLSIPQTSHRHFSSLARRLGRIFAHAYFHHREVFEQAEAESSLYARFLKLSSQFDLVPSEFLVIPEDHDGRGRDEDVEPPRLLAAAVHPSQIFPHPTGIDHPTGTDSPRRLGRSRTDTMVFSEAYNVAEEL